MSKPQTRTTMKQVHSVAQQSSKETTSTKKQVVHQVSEQIKETTSTKKQVVHQVSEESSKGKAIASKDPISEPRSMEIVSTATNNELDDLRSMEFVSTPTKNQVSGSRNMERQPTLLKDVHNGKELWKIAIKVKDKWNYDKEGKQSFMLLVVDSKNFQVLNNDDQFKLSDHNYKLRLSGGTRVLDVNKHDIPYPMPKFKDFVEITMGNFREDLLYDVIGVLDDIGFTQAVQGSRKAQVNFHLKDLSGNQMLCTLWEHYALQFITYTRENNVSGPTIVYMKYAKIKPAGRYPLAVSNTWTSTRLYINDKVPEILAFTKRLADAVSSGTMADIVQTPSQLMSQSSGVSIYTPEQKLLNKAEIMSLSQIMALSQETICVTVVKTARVRFNPKGWYYQELMLMFNMEIVKQLLHSGTVNAASLRDQMLAIGIDDPCDYPTTIITIEGRTLAIKVKWQPKWSNGSVQGVHEGESFIEGLKAQFTPSQDPNLLEQASSPLLEDVTSSQAVESNADTDCVIPTACLSDDDDQQDPYILAMKTPSKRTGASIKDDNVDNGDLIGSKMSSTKMPKQAKMEKFKLKFCNSLIFMFMFYVYHKNLTL
ncbi:hypothetical protein TSUD_403420 [Trifolium subterraneum]|uniref:DUF223 domain-containing protein n=1 Tax=Trifolium subterraneum TaxID=3900 RepID=A0A2Z6PL32_TRISU|nr:hypothetical protein TSUD_403420 [Trifolium subterraneum]